MQQPEGMTTFNQNYNYQEFGNQQPQNPYMNQNNQQMNSNNFGTPYNSNSMGTSSQFLPQGNFNPSQPQNTDPGQGYFRDPRLRARNPNGTASDNITCLKFGGNFCNVLCFPCNMCCNKNTITISLGTAGIMMEQGEFKKILPPGFYYYNNCLHNIIIVSLKTKTLDLNGASLLTSDNMSVSLQVVIGYKVVDPYLATFAVDNLPMVIRDISLGLIKRVVGGFKFQALLHSQGKLMEEFRSGLERILRKAGVIVPFADVTEINIPQSMVSTMATSAISQKESEAKQLIAESERQSSMMLKRAGEIMGKNKSSVNLMYFDTLKKIAEYDNHTIILPDGMVYVPVKGD